MIGEKLRASPPAPSSDISTPLGLSRQHLSYLQEIGSGWFGKVRGLGGRQRGYPYISGMCSCSVSTPFVICSWPPQSHALQPAPPPPPRTHSHPPTPTSVGQRLPPHSIDHSASPPGSPRVRQSVHPSIRPACIGFWACESLTPCLVGEQGGGTLREGLGVVGSLKRGELPRGPARHRSALIVGLLDQVILGEVFSDYSPAQVVVKELRASAGPLEQRKFISEAQPYRYVHGQGF